MSFKFIQKLCIRKLAITALIAVVAFSVQAGEKESSDVKAAAINVDPTSSGYIVQLVVGLFIVLLCIVVLAWLAKRFNGFQASTGGVLRIVGAMSMSARERVVLVQVGSTQLLLGVAPGRINTLHVLDQPIEKTSDSSDKTLGQSFSEKLSSAIMRDNK